MTKKGVVNIRGKEYLTVAKRVADFREVFKPTDGWCIRTWVVSNEGDRVVVSASICDKDDHVVATGFAEEDRTQGTINKTSALENCETSAIGRALAAFGLGGDEYCSADELMNALHKQESIKPEPVPVQKQPEEKPKKENPKDRISRHLGRMEAAIGEDETRSRLTTLMRHNTEVTGGKLTVADMTSVPDLWRLSDKVKEMVETFFTQQQTEEESNGVQTD